MSTMTNQQNNGAQAPQDMRPSVIEERTEGNPVAEERHEEAGHQSEEHTPSEPTRFANPRDRIAAKQRARRAEQSDEVFYDEMGIPPEVRNAPADPPQDRQQQQQDTQRGGQAAPPSDSGVQGGPNLRLSVNHNTFEVSRADALRYAEIDESEADLYNDVQIVRLAQKHLAAQQRLDEAKAAAAAARSAPSARAASPTPGQNQEAEVDEHGTQQPPQPDHHSRGRETVESVLFEDPDVAAERLGGFVQETVHQSIQNIRQAEREQSLRHEIAGIVREAEQVHPEIANDRIASLAVLDAAYDDIEGELHRIGATPEITARLRHEGKLVEGYVAACARGHNLRPPREIFSEAISSTRQSLEQRNYLAPRAPSSQQQPDNGAQSRIDAKRGLIQQPQRSMPTPQTQQRPQLSVEEARRAAILQRRQTQQARFR